MTWTPCDMQLPADLDTVLTYIPDDVVPVWFGYRDAGEWYSASGDEIEHPVTHWAPLPDGPEGT